MTELRTLAHRYRLLRRVGAGATATVHLAEDLRDGSHVALKVFGPELANDPEGGARLAREATASSSIAHPNVARALDFGCDPDGTPWLATEWAEGRTLREILDAGPLHPARALRLARQVLEALEAAHAAGVIHRDVKPENVLVVAGEGFDEETVKVLDFGLAKLDRARHADLGPGTAAGMVFGTPAYLAPERFRCEPPDPRSDLYSLGAMLFEAIAGAPPFDGDDLTVLAKHVTVPAPPLTSPFAADALVPALRGFVSKLLAKAPQARPASARAAILELDQALARIDEHRAAAHALAPPVRSASAPASSASSAKPTGRLRAWARSYGLEPHQLVYAFAVALGLVVLVIAVALAS